MDISSLSSPNPIVSKPSSAVHIRHSSKPATSAMVISSSSSSTAVVCAAQDINARYKLSSSIFAPPASACIVAASSSALLSAPSSTEEVHTTSIASVINPSATLGQTQDCVFTLLSSSIEVNGFIYCFLLFW